MIRRYNFKKANWDNFKTQLDTEINKITPIPENYGQFSNLVKNISKQNIPRGCRTQYIPGMGKENKELLENYINQFNNDPFAEETIITGESLVEKLSEARREKWRSLISETDMTQNSSKAWRMLRNLGNDPKNAESHINVTSNEIAHQLLKNEKCPGIKKVKPKIGNEPTNEANLLHTPFTLEELDVAMARMKEKKAPGVDEIRTEHIKNFGQQTKRWLLELYNNCIKCVKILIIWRKSRIIALIKPGKQPTEAKNFRPISLLCHTYKLLERLILNRINDIVDKSLINEQAGFRGGKSCTGRILNLTENIENGYEKKLMTGAVFIDLTAAYDTINHRILFKKMYEITSDYNLMSFIAEMLRNRRYFVELQGKKSRWRTQKNELAPLLFNIYTNDQPTPLETQRFIYADDLALTA